MLIHKAGRNLHYALSILLAVGLVPAFRFFGLPLRIEWASFFVTYWWALHFSRGSQPLVIYDVVLVPSSKASHGLRMEELSATHPGHHLLVQSATWPYSGVCSLMGLGTQSKMIPTKRASKLAVSKVSAAVAGICACAALLSFAAHAAQMGLPRDMLWQVVHNVCVPGQSQHHDPTPCLQVDLTGGTENGFAILRDPLAAVHFLLIPTARISGIESPIVRGPDATNYFSSAWEARTYIDETLHRVLPRDDVGLAINSAVGRSQDQLHIHLACIRADVLEAVHQNEERIGDRWSRLNVSLAGHDYMAMWLPGEQLGPSNPFALLAERTDAARDMSNWTLVLVGLTRPDGTRGFVLLANQADKQGDDLANGEELLDHACTIATTAKHVPGRTPDR